MVVTAESKRKPLVTRPPPQCTFVFSLPIPLIRVQTDQTRLVPLVVGRLQGPTQWENKDGLAAAAAPAAAATVVARELLLLSLLSSEVPAQELQRALHQAAPLSPSPGHSELGARHVMAIIWPSPTPPRSIKLQVGRKGGGGGHKLDDEKHPNSHTHTHNMPLLLFRPRPPRPGLVLILARAVLPLNYKLTRGSRPTVHAPPSKIPDPPTQSLWLAPHICFRSWAYFAPLSPLG